MRNHSELFCPADSFFPSPLLLPERLFANTIKQQRRIKALRRVPQLQGTKEVVRLETTPFPACLQYWTITVTKTGIKQTNKQNKPITQKWFGLPESSDVGGPCREMGMGEFRRAGAALWCSAWLSQINHHLVQQTRDPNKVIIFKPGSLQV